jgi:hypothetical protein
MLYIFDRCYWILWNRHRCCHMIITMGRTKTKNLEQGRINCIIFIQLFFWFLLSVEVIILVWNSSLMFCDETWYFHRIANHLSKITYICDNGFFWCVCTCIIGFYVARWARVKIPFCEDRILFFKSRIVNRNMLTKRQSTENENLILGRYHLSVN